MVYLKSWPEDFLCRSCHDVSRPQLQVADPLSRLRELYAARYPLYHEAVHFSSLTGCVRDRAALSEHDYDATGVISAIRDCAVTE